MSMMMMMKTMMMAKTFHFLPTSIIPITGPMKAQTVPSSNDSQQLKERVNEHARSKMKGESGSGIRLEFSPSSINSHFVVSVVV